MKLRLKYTGSFVSGFLILALIFFGIFITLIMLDKKIFTEKYYFKTQFADAAGLSSSTPILFRGFNIGRIDDFHLTDENNVEAEFIIYEGFQNKIVKHSALNKSIDPISNASSLTFLEGPDRDAVLPEGSFIPSINSEEGAKLLASGKIEKKGNLLYNILTNLDNTLEVLSVKDSANQNVLKITIASLNVLVKNLSSVMGKLNSLADNANVLVEDNNSTLNQALINIAVLADDIKESNKVLKSGLVHLDTLIVAYSNPGGLIKDIIDSSGTLTGNAGILLEQSAELATTINKEAYKLPVLLNNLNTALRELNLTLEAINTSPLLNIEEKKETKKAFGRKINPK
ncbi:MAG: MCE family protein [Bacteroidetes bacterium]|nr:MCE family protein [Bacteroidota bacterium]MBU2505228.1 MCE family protein [Bacteroidota bacterium]